MTPETVIVWAFAAVMALGAVCMAALVAWVVIDIWRDLWKKKR